MTSLLFSNRYHLGTKILPTWSKQSLVIKDLAEGQMSNSRKECLIMKAMTLRIDRVMDCSKITPQLLITA